MSMPLIRKRLAIVLALALTALTVGGVSAWALGTDAQPETSQLTAQADAQVKGPDVDALTGQNWMSAIPDQRYLYEINIPGTHDASMKDSWGRKWHQSFSTEYVYAETQDLYLNEQLDAGVRLFDLRFTDGQYIPDDWKKTDTDYMAYNCHGNPNEAIDCLYFARDKNKVFYNSYSTLDMMCNFLSKHPTETIILSMDYESGSSAEGTMKRLRNCLDIFAKRYNPYVRKPYIYTQGSSKIITEMPMLKDVRGQIVILSGRTDLLGYGMQVSLPNAIATTSIAGTTFACENHYEVTSVVKKNLLKIFYEGGTIKYKTDTFGDWVTDSSERHRLYLPRNLDSHVSHGNYVYTTTNRPAFTKIEYCSPGDAAKDEVNPYLYTEPNAYFKTVGRYYGWVCSDYVTNDTVKTFWKTNFPDDLEYVSYTFQYNDPRVPNQTLTVMRDTQITLPTANELSNMGIRRTHGTLVEWLVNGEKTLKPGTTLTLDESTTIEMQWSMTWEDLQDQIYSHAAANDTTPIRLTSDITSSEDSRPLVINSGTNITIDLNGHTLKRHRYGKGGMVFVMHGNANLTITGSGTVIGGTAGRDANYRASDYGVIRVGSGSTLTLINDTGTGALEIHDNSAASGGPIAIYGDGTLNVQGNVKIENNYNTGGDVPGDVFLVQGSVVNVTGKLDGSARIGVVSDAEPAEGAPIVVSKGLAQNGSIDNFFSSDERYQIVEVAGEACLVKSLEVTFDSMGGSDVNKAYAKNNATVSKPDDPKKDHCTFKGWYTAAQGGEEYDFTKPVTQNLTLYARWEANTLTINYDSNGGTSVEPQTVPYGTTATPPADPTREGYTFAGWKYFVSASRYMRGGYLLFNFEKPVTYDVNLTAFWDPIACKLSFDSNGGSEVAAQSVSYGKQATKPADPTREGYIFTGWTLKDGTAFDFGTALREDMTLYANWLPVQHTVTFDSRGGTSVSAQLVAHDTQATKPADPSRKGYEFVDWRSEAAPEVPYDFSANVTSDLNLYATWRPVVYTVSFDTRGGGEVTPQTVEYGQKATRPVEDPTREGYDFMGWKYMPPQSPYMNRSASPFSFDTPITSNMTLLASWAPISCTVSFDSRGGSEVEPQVVAYGNQAEQPAAPTMEGSLFAGWFTDEDCTVPYGFDAPVRESMTLYAGWIGDPTDPSMLVIVFDSAGGTPVDHQVLEVGQTVTEPSSPTRYGYDYGGWFVDGDPSRPYDFGTPLAADLLLKAQWTPATYTVSFDTMGAGNAPESQQVSFDALASAPSDPTWEGHDFDGWYAQEPEPLSDEVAEQFRNDPDLSREYWITDDNYLRYYFDFDSIPIEGDQTLYARWTSQTHTVSFDAQGGSAVEAQQGIVHGEMATEPDDPIREHYWFDGWFLDAECSRPYDFATPVTDDLTLYAGWVAQAYEVLLIPGNADECQVQNVSYGELANKPADPVRSGYRFDGWFVDGDRTKPYDFEAPVQDNLVIEGRWTQEGFTVTFDVDGGTPQPAIQQVAPNDLVEEPSAPTKDGSVFVGWYEIVRTDLTDEEIDAILSDPVLSSTVLVVGHEALLAYDFASPVTSELTLRAIWVGVTHTIAFQTNGGSAIAAEQGIAHGDAARQPANPTREGYTFAGWYVDAACTRPYFFTEPVLEDLTLYAGWKERTYTVIFASYGGTYISRQTVPHGRRATRPTNPRRVGYEFVYWYQSSWTVVGPLGGLVAQEDEPTQEYDFDAPVTSDLVLLAQWDEGSYTVRFDTDGGTPAPEDQSLEAGSYAQQPEDPQKEGQLFLGWYAQEPEPLSDEDAARFRNDPDLSREYWITDDNYLRYYFDFGLMTIDDDTTLYARWASPTHTVTFADEEGIVGQLTVDHGSTIAEDAALVREGYVAQAWYTDPEHAYRYDLGSSVASDITLYADRYLKDCDVTLMLGEAELYVQTLSWGQTLEQLPSSVEGYDFLGWYADAALSEPLDNSTPVTADMTVYGSWTPTILTVTLDSNGGTEVSPQTQQVAYGELATVPADPVREGYVFKGWYEDWTGCLTAEQLSMYAQSDDEDARELVSVLVMNDDGLYRVYDLKNQPTYSDVTLVALWEKSPSDDGNNTKPSDGSSGKATPAASTKPSTTATTATKPSATTLPRTGDVSGLPLAAALAMAGVGLIALARRAKEW